MKVALTGSGGFLGSYVLQLLNESEINVSIFDKRKHSLDDPQSLQDFLLGSTCVVHLAGVNRSDDQDILRVNTLGTQGLLIGMSRFCKGATIVFASSFQIYNSKNIYGLSKLFAEKLIQNFASRKLLSASILRFSNLYGPGAKPDYNSVIATFAEKIRKHEQLNVHGDGLAKRDFLYVTDAARAVQAAIEMKRPRRFAIYNICSGKQESLRHVLKLLQKMTPYDINKLYNATMTKDEWQVGEKNYLKAKGALSWEPTVTLEEGIKRLLSV